MNRHETDVKQGSTAIAGEKAGRRRLPPWLRVNLSAGDAKRRFNGTQSAVVGNQLHTVCEEARCPNIHDCWGRGTATFMIAGKECTRGCRFCAVETLRTPPPLDADEPAHLAAAVERMGLDHAVVTVVNRDDLPDGGADHYKRCIQAVHERLPRVTLELLSSDLAGNEDALSHLLDSVPLDVFAHNVECVPRLDRQVRDPRASFQLSLSVLAGSKRRRPELLTKSSLMIGLGEIDREVTEVMMRLREADVDLLTLGQYIAPGGRHLPVDRYVPPEQFDAWDEEARALGFKAVASGPLVRSSYRAGLLLEEARTGQRLVGRSSATTTGAASHEATPSGCCGTASPAQDVAVQAEALMKSALLMTKKGK